MIAAGLCTIALASRLLMRMMQDVTDEELPEFLMSETPPIGTPGYAVLLEFSALGPGWHGRRE